MSYKNYRYIPTKRPYGVVNGLVASSFKQNRGSYVKNLNGKAQVINFNEDFEYMMQIDLLYMYFENAGHNIRENNFAANYEEITRVSFHIIK